MTEDEKKNGPPCSAGEKISTKQVREPGRRGRPKVAKSKGDQKPFVLKVREDGRPRKRQGKGSGKDRPEVVLDGATNALPVPRGVGRPTKYNQDVTARICELLACGWSLRKICELEEMPCLFSVFKWLNEYPEFSSQYTLAKEQQAETMADMLIDIADECEDPNKARLQIETRKWIAAKLKPKKYGDRIDINKTVDITVTGIKRVIVDEAIEGEIITADRMLDAPKSQK